jgi:hypothetical protein
MYMSALSSCSVAQVVPDKLQHSSTCCIYDKKAFQIYATNPLPLSSF